jgi:hypothetical protein
MTQRTVRIDRMRDGRYIPRVITGENRDPSAVCTHRHWTKITARSCGNILLSGLSRIEGEEE